MHFYAMNLHSTVYAVMEFMGFAQVYANRFLEVQLQQTRSYCDVIYVYLNLFIMREPVVSKFYTKENLFLKF